MIFHKIKDDGKKLTLEYSEIDPHNHRQRIHKAIRGSDDRPRPEFNEAMAKFRREVCRILSLSELHQKHMTVTGISVSLDSQERRHLTITAQVNLPDLGSPWVLNTPSLREPDPDDEQDGQYSSSTETLLDNLEAEAIKYLEGERQQADLWPSKTTEESTPRENVEVGFAIVR